MSGVDRCRWRARNVKHIAEMCADVLIAGAECEQSDDFTFQFVREVGLVLLDDLGLEGAGPVYRCVQLKAASRPSHGLATETVLRWRCPPRPMGFLLTLHGGFGVLLDQRGQEAVFAGEVFAPHAGLRAASISNVGGFGHESSLFGSI